MLHLGQIVLQVLMLVDCLVAGRASLSMKTKLLTVLQKKTISKNSCQYETGNRLLVGGGSDRLHRNGREASKLVLLHGVARFQLVLVSQWTVATIIGLHSRDGPGRQKDKAYDGFGCFGCTQKLGAQSQGVCWLSHTVQSLVCPR